MLSSHFPGTYGVASNWLILITVFIAGGVIKHFLNIKNDFKHWLTAAIGTLVIAIIFILTIVAPPAPNTTVWVIVKEWSQVLGRFAHVMVAILWIGNSMFFTWLTLSFRPQKTPEDGVDGEVWMLHGGGFFHVKKRPLETRFVPKTLHWFKWESYTTLANWYVHDDCCVLFVRCNSFDGTRQFCFINFRYPFRSSVTNCGMVSL